MLPLLPSISPFFGYFLSPSCHPFSRPITLIDCYLCVIICSIKICFPSHFLCSTSVLFYFSLLCYSVSVLLSDRPSILLSLPRTVSTRVLILSQQWCLHFRDLSFIDARSVSQTSSSNTSRLCPLQKLCYKTLSVLYPFVFTVELNTLVTINFICIASLLSSQNPRDWLPNNQWWKRSGPGKNPEQEQASICGVY